MTTTDTALIVIDVQESFRHRPYFREEGLPAFLERQQALIDGAEAAGIPVVQVFHVEESGPFSKAFGLVTTLMPLRIAPNAVFRKARHSALVGTGLDVWLTRTGIRRLIVSGIRTEQCCETTTRHASDLGRDHGAPSRPLEIWFGGSQERRSALDTIRKPERCCP